MGVGHFRLGRGFVRAFFTSFSHSPFSLSRSGSGPGGFLGFSAIWLYSVHQLTVGKPLVIRSLDRLNHALPVTQRPVIMPELEFR